MGLVNSDPLSVKITGNILVNNSVPKSYSNLLNTSITDWELLWSLMKTSIIPQTFNCKVKTHLPPHLALHV